MVYFDLRNKENHLGKRSRSAVLDPGLGTYRYNPRFSLLSPTTELLLLYFADEEIVVQRDSHLASTQCGVMGSDHGGVKAVSPALAERRP